MTISVPAGTEGAITNMALMQMRMTEAMIPELDPKQMIQKALNPSQDENDTTQNSDLVSDSPEHNY